MNRQLDQAIDRCVARLAGVCRASSYAAARQLAADSNRELLAALRLVAGGMRTVGGREYVDPERLRWLLGEATFRLVQHVDDRLAGSPRLDAEGKAALHAEFAEAFAMIMSDVEASLEAVNGP